MYKQEIERQMNKQINDQRERKRLNGRRERKRRKNLEKELWLCGWQTYTRRNRKVRKRADG
jgi:hypothetical protein